MSTSIPARQPAGRPTGGQFAATEHGESDVTLAPALARPDELEGWPESLPAPTIDFGFLDDGQIETWVKSGDHEIALVTTDYGRGRVDVEVNAGLPFDDESVSEQAKAWAIKAHRQFEDEIRQEMEAAAMAARHRIAAKITGTPRQLTDSELAELSTNAFRLGDQTTAEGELATIALMSRDFLQKYPEAATVTVDTDIDRTGGLTQYISGFVVHDAEGNELATHKYGGYTTADGRTGDDDDEIWDLVTSVHLESPMWDRFRPANSAEEIVVDLRPASIWTPENR